MCFQSNRKNGGKTVFLVKEADKLRHQKRNAEYQLEQLNFGIEKIREAGQLKDRVVVRTSEREKQDDEAEREKRKCEEDESVESTSKKSKVQPVTSEGELLETEDDPDVSMLLSEAEEGKLMNVDLIKKLSKEVASELVKSTDSNELSH